MSVDPHAPYFEDFRVGDQFEHRRGHTVSEADNQTLSLLTMNTAQTHYNADSLRDYMDGAFPAPLLNACVAFALAVGLTSDDLSAHAKADRGYAEFRMPNPVFVGDTLYASSEILATGDAAGAPDLGEVRYRIVARKTDGTQVVTVVRTMLVKRRSQWQSADEDFVRTSHAAASALLAGSATES